MKPLEGRKLITEFLLSLSTPGEDDLPVLEASTVRAYASQLQRMFASIVEFPYIDGFQPISSKYGPIENPFTGVEYPIHSRDHLRSERFFLTPEQILEVLIFLGSLSSSYPSPVNGRPALYHCIAHHRNRNAIHRDTQFGRARREARHFL